MLANLDLWSFELNAAEMAQMGMRVCVCLYIDRIFIYREVERERERQIDG